MDSSQGEQRILAIFANPKGTNNLRLGEEDRVLRECLRLARHRRLRLETRHAATVHDLRRDLLDEQAHVVHFSGHGTGQGLAFEDETGHVKVIPARALGELLSAYVPPVHTVVLNACYSTVHADALAKIPFVIVMRQAVADRTAIEFARGFYDALAAGKDSEFAFFEGLRTVNLLGLGGDNIPQLFESGRPVTSQNPRPSPDPVTRPDILSAKVAERPEDRERKNVVATVPPVIADQPRLQSLRHRLSVPIAELERYHGLVQSLYLANKWSYSGELLYPPQLLDADDRFTAVLREFSRELRESAAEIHVRFESALPKSDTILDLYVQNPLKTVVQALDTAAGAVDKLTELRGVAKLGSSLNDLRRHDIYKRAVAALNSILDEIEQAQNQREINRDTVAYLIKIGQALSKQ